MDTVTINVAISILLDSTGLSSRPRDTLQLIDFQAPADLFR